MARPGSDPATEVTGLLRAWSGGDQSALESLVPIVDRELRRIAKRHLEREHPDASLQTTSLLDEAYTRLIAAKQGTWQDRAHFFAVCAQIIRRILVDHARARRTVKRGGGVRPIPLDEGLMASKERAADLVAIDDALEALAKTDARKGRVVELRFFGGLSVEETAAVLRVSKETVMRDWRLAKVWLMRELSSEQAARPAGEDR